MADGVLYKSNGTTWSKSQAKKSNGSVLTANQIRHSNGTTWFDNFPMEQNYTQTFNATWSQGWRGDGVRLDDGVWQGNVLVGSTTGFRGMYGFSPTAIQSFLGTGKVVSARLQVYCYETTTNGAPDVQIGKHSYASKPAGTWTGQYADWTNYASLHIPNDAVGAYWVTLNPTQILINGKAIGGVALRAASNTDENHGKFRGVNSYTTKLEITVLK